MLRPGERRTPPLDVLHPGVELKVVDEAGAPVPDGGTGEICIRGVCVTPGLYKTPPGGDLRRRRIGSTPVTSARWTGERVHFHGRMGEMIKTAGANVTPKEVVEALWPIDGVATAHVVALPDPFAVRWWRRPSCRRRDARSTPMRSDAELKNELSTFEVPAYIEFFRADNIPWTQSFKIRRGMLAEMIKERVASTGR